MEEERGRPPRFVRGVKQCMCGAICGTVNVPFNLKFGSLSRDPKLYLLFHIVQNQTTSSTALNPNIIFRATGNMSDLIHRTLGACQSLAILRPSPAYQTLIMGSGTRTKDSSSSREASLGANPSVGTMRESFGLICQLWGGAHPSPTDSVDPSPLAEAPLEGCKWSETTGM